MYTPRRTFGVNESALDANSTPGSPPSDERHVLGRTSFSQAHHRPSFISRWGRGQDEEVGVNPAVSDRPAIPSALEPKGETYSTPLPVLSMVVLSIVRALALYETSFFLRGL